MSKRPCQTEPVESPQNGNKDDGDEDSFDVVDDKLSEDDDIDDDNESDDEDDECDACLDTDGGLNHMLRVYWDCPKCHARHDVEMEESASSIPSTDWNSASGYLTLEFGPIKRNVSCEKCGVKVMIS